MIALDPKARGSIIIAGSTNQAGTALAAFSNRAGGAASVYLAAAGEKLQAYELNGSLAPKSGTSVSAPVIAGAVALLAQAFPNLSGQQIVNLLLTTASDLGAVGVDAESGWGALNLGKAFSPQGTTSLAGSMTPLSLSVNGVLSPAMGDATGDLQGAVFLDGYKRAYETDLGRTLGRAAQDKPLHAALDGSYSTRFAGSGSLAVSITTTRDMSATPEALLHQLELRGEQARRGRAIATTVIGRLSPKTTVALGLFESGRVLQQRFSDHQGNAFLVARDPVTGNGFHARVRASMGLRHDFGPFAVALTSEGGEVQDSSPVQDFGRSPYRITSLVADRQLGPLRFSFGGSLLDEEATILGGRFASVFSSGGSTSWFADGAASADLGSGWGAYASYRHGRTSARGGAALVQGGELSSDAFAFDLTKTGTFAGRDKLAFRLMQPLRVNSGGFDVNLPVSYDYASSQVGYQQRFFNLAPTGREMNYEISYATRLLGGNIAANTYLRTDPGHIERIKRDVGGALRFTLGF
jgi:hypothetical protein